MKSFLMASLALNALCLALIFLLTHAGLYSRKSQQTHAATPVLSLATHSQPVSDAMRHCGFSWRQLESTDYRIYVANLRAIGCPEQTVAEIIQADLHDLYTSKRILFGLTDQATVGPWSIFEEAHVIDTLLGHQNRAVPELSAAQPVLPLVFRPFNPERVQLDPEQQAAVTELREQFVQALGGTNQDTSDPAYEERWLRAQPANDRLLRGLIGVNAFMRYQNEAE